MEDGMGVPSWEPLDGTVLVNASKLCPQLLSPLFTLHSSSHRKKLSQLKKLRNPLPLKVVTGFLLVISHYVSHSHLGSLFDCSYV